jgi:hypothetical protein
MNEDDREMLPLLAGWLDGELSAEDARRVETALVRSPELQEVLERWRLHDEAMPRGEAFRSEAEWEALARRVDRAIAADTETVDGTESGRARASSPKPEPGWRRLAGALRPKRLAYGGMSTLVVAALVLLLYPRQEEMLKRSEDVAQKTARRIELAEEASEKGGPSAIDRAAETIEEEGMPPVVSEVALPPANVPEAVTLAEDVSPPTGPEAETVEGGTPKKEETLPVRETDGAPWETVMRAEPETPVETEERPISDDRMFSRGGRTEEIVTRVTVPAAPPPAAATRTEPGRERSAPPPLPALPGAAESVGDVERWLRGDVVLSVGESRVAAVEAEPRLHAETKSGYPRAMAESDALREADAPRPPEPDLEGPGGVAAEPDPTSRALARAMEDRRVGRREAARAGLLLLTGDFPENRVRDTAWFLLLEMDLEEALDSGDIVRLDRVSEDLERWLVTFPDGARRADALGQLARARIRLAKLDPLDPARCVAARRAFADWEREAGPSDLDSTAGATLRTALESFCRE